MSTALIIVDVQNDFLPGGALGAPDGDSIIEPILKLAKQHDHVIATRDWHPKAHISFSDEPTFEDGSWPPHCVQETTGAELHPEILAISEAVVSKGEVKNKEAYSGFQGTATESGLTLLRWLQEHQVDHVTVAGLVTEYCVKATALDAVDEGFRVRVNTHAVGSLGPDSARQARQEMADWGVIITDREPRGDREATRDEAIEDAIITLVEEAEDAEHGNYHDMSAWLGSLVKWVREETDKNEGEITLTFPDAFFQDVRVIHIPAKETVNA